MTDLITRLRLEASAGNSAAVIGGVKKDVEGLGPAGVKAGAGLGQATTAGEKLDRELIQIGTHGPTAKRGLDQAEAGARGFERSANGARAAGFALGAALAAVGGRELAGAITDAALQLQGFETGLSAVTGGAQNAGQAQAFVREQAERLGLVIRTSTADYMSLAAATNGTALAGENTRNIWLGVNEAGAVMHLTQERQQLAMQAISQMASKQVISQEELRQQLSEALPGAYQVAQRAMGLTSQEFNKLVGSGKLLAEDFLPKFAAQLRKEFGPSVEQSLITPMGQARVEIAKFKNTVFDLEASAGGEFLAGMRQGLAELNSELTSPDAQEAARALGQLLGEGLSNAAEIAAFLAKNLDGVTLAAQLVVGVGLARWLTTTTVEARAAAAAYLMKGQAAQAAAVLAAEGAAVEARAVTTLRGSIEAAARAQLQAAVVDREAALSRQALAQATLAQHRAQLTSLSSSLGSAQRLAAITAAEAELVIAKNATAVASGRAAAAEIGLATASTTMGAAMAGAKTMASGLLGMLGGPWGIALMAAGAAVAFVSHQLAESEAQARAAQEAQKSYSAAMDEAAQVLAEAAGNTRAWSGNTAGAVEPTGKLTNATRLLTDQTIKLGDARRQAALAGLQESEQKLRAELKSLDGKATRETVKVVIGQKTDGSPVYGQMLAAARREQAKDELAAAMSASIKLIVAPPTPIAKPPSATTTPATKPDRQELRAQIKDSDLAAAVVAQNAHTVALIAGGRALDEWQIAEAGRQAVERLALADRPKLTAAETALVASIRSRAEETERLKIANERIEKSVGLAKSADLDTAALQRRSIAAAQGEAALEALQVQEAGLRVLQQLGVDSLDQVTGETLKHAKAAMASAQASEAQSIATQKAERAAAQIRDLDKRLASELAYTTAMKGGTAAVVAYQRAEFERQEIERAGTNLTADQVAQIRAKADALFAVQAAGESAALEQHQAEELRLARLTNQERAIEQRYLERKSLLLAEHADWTEAEVDARARALALADQAAAEDAAAIGDLKEALRQTFIESGKLGFNDVADYAEQRLRTAVYDALLAKPFDIVINAVVGSLSGLTSGALGLSGGANGGVGGLTSLLTASGALKGLTTGATNALTGGLSSLGVSGWNAAKFGGLGGAAIGGAGTGLLVSGLAGALGLKQNTGNQVGGAIGGAIGSFIPIPGGTLIGSAIGNLLGGLVGGKKSNEAAVVSLDNAGAVTDVGGAKRNDATTAAAQSIASAVAQIQAALVAGGATLGATVSKIDIGQRDPTHLNFSNGSSIDTAVGDVSAAVEAATKTILANAKWATEAQTAYAQKMLAAGASIDQVVSTLQAAGTLSTSLDDAIAQLVDPAAYERKAALDAIEANYKALKTQAQTLIDAGLATGDVLAKIDQLKDLQVADALKRLGEAADSAAAALDPASFAASIADGIASLSDPTSFGRAQAMAEIETNIGAMRAQATSLVAAGQLSTAVFAELDKLHDLQVAESIKKLGDAATDAAKALSDAAASSKAAADFSGSIDDEILKLTDPDTYSRKSAIDKINKDYEARVAQAQPMIAAGALSADILDKLAAVRDLQIADTLSNLAGAAQEATDVFAEARPRLQAWLDGLSTGSNSALNPGEQRQAAMASYERLLERARGGDADALSQITGSADQLLSSDRIATSSASDRLALQNKVQGDIQGLIGMSGSAVGATPQIVQLTKVNIALEKLTAFMDPALIATRPPAPMEVRLSPWLQQMHKVATDDQTSVLKLALDKLLDETKAAHGDTVTGLVQLGKDISSGLGGLANAVSASAAGTASTIAGLSESISQLSRSNSLTNTYIKQAVAR